MSHTVGTKAFANHIQNAHGLIVGTATATPFFIDREGLFVDQVEAHANALLWAGAAKLLDACRAVDADIERDGAVSAATIEAVRAAINGATVPKASV